MDRRNNARAKHTNWRSPTLKWRLIILFIVAFQLSYAIFTENDYVMSKVSFISGLTRSISRRSKNADDLIISRSKIKSKIFAHFNKNGHVLWKFDWLVDERSCKVYDLAKICDHDWKYTIIRRKYAIICWEYTIFYLMVYDPQKFLFLKKKNWDYTIIRALTKRI